MTEGSNFQVRVVYEVKNTDISIVFIIGEKELLRILLDYLGLEENVKDSIIKNSKEVKVVRI